MTPVRLEEVDEVWLALDQMEISLTRSGHQPQETILNCMDCYTLFLVRNAKKVYRERQQ